jgi:hypothetical protein
VRRGAKAVRDVRSSMLGRGPLMDKSAVVVALEKIVYYRNRVHTG